MKGKEITTEKTRQSVIAYFKKEGFELFKTEGITALQAELEKAKELIRELISVHVVDVDELGEPKASLNELIELYTKATTFLNEGKK